MGYKVLLKKEKDLIKFGKNIYCSVVDTGGIILVENLPLFNLVQDTNIIFDHWYRPDPHSGTMIYINLASFMKEDILEICIRNYKPNGGLLGPEGSSYYFFEILFLQTEYIPNTFKKSR